MGRSIFVSYKHQDSQVAHLNNQWDTTARDYVDLIEQAVEDNDHVYKGERDGEDLSGLAEETIVSKLSDKIFYSSITLVLMTAGMKENKPERDQWIPWEISYSLRSVKRAGTSSTPNALLGVVVPDIIQGYTWLLKYNAQCQSTSYQYIWVFDIIKANMFNHRKKEDSVTTCNGSTIYTGEPCYMTMVTIEEFLKSPNKHLDRALEIRSRIAEYDLVKKLS